MKIVALYVVQNKMESLMAVNESVIPLVSVIRQKGVKIEKIKIHRYSLLRHAVLTLAMQATESNVNARVNTTIRNGKNTYHRMFVFIKQSFLPTSYHII